MTKPEFNHLLSQIKALPPDQMRQVRQQIDSALAQPQQPVRTPDRAAKRAKPAQAPKKPLSIEELHRKLLAEGRISRLPDTAADFDDPDDQPIAIEGEPLSETIIRERR
jgi:hypothetical protein